jgi:Family of unknown function (DUF6152)
MAMKTMPPTMSRGPRICRSIVVLMVVTLVPVGRASAHHSSAAVYDRDSFVEAEGDIIDMSWVNPHVRFKLRSVADGRIWEIESNSVSVVSRFGLDESVVKVGTHVKLAGNGGRLRDDIMWVTNMLLPDGREILFGSGIAARWSTRTVGADTRGAVAADTANVGLFRVWTSVTSPPDFWRQSYPLTAAAAAKRAAFRPVVDDPTKNCAPKGMPYLMEQPYPIEFMRDGDDIALKLEEYDSVRHIAMSSAPGTAKRNAPRLGRSTGHWEGAVLVVETSDIDYPHFDGRGIPLAPGARVEERFTLNADGSRLDYTLTVTDPGTFTAPVTLEKQWEWRPGEHVRPYGCRPDSAAVQ